jgi:multidrug efflux pump subunit AcrB
MLVLTLPKALAPIQTQSPTLAAANSKIGPVRVNSLDDIPKDRYKIDKQKDAVLSLSHQDINCSLRVTWGTHDANHFIVQGLVKCVNLQQVHPLR